MSGRDLSRANGVELVVDHFLRAFRSIQKKSSAAAGSRRPLKSCGHETRDWYFIAERPAPALHLACPEECAVLRIVLVTVSRVSHSCEHFPDGFDLSLPQNKKTSIKQLKRPLTSCI